MGDRSWTWARLAWRVSGSWKEGALWWEEAISLFPASVSWSVTRSASLGGDSGGDEPSRAVGRSHLSREPLGCTISIYNWMSRGFSEPENPCV